MIEKITDIFKLEKKEKEIFLQLFQLGEQPASIIANRLKLPRNSTRFILDNLCAIGLVTKTKIGNTQIYAIEKKENILKSVEISKKKNLQEFDKKLEVINEFGHELDNRFESKKIPKIRFYEGEAGIEKVYEDTLNSQEEIKSWASFDGMHEGLPEYFNSYYKRRAGNKISIRSIHPDTKLAIERTKNDSQELRKSKLVNSKKYNWIPEIQVYDNKINIVSWYEKIGIIIESKEIAEALKAIFDISWDNLR